MHSKGCAWVQSRCRRACTQGDVQDSDLLERRVVELVLVPAGDCRPHALVGPQTGEGVAQEWKQHLILVKAAAAGQDRVGVNLHQKKTQNKWASGGRTSTKVCLRPLNWINGLHHATTTGR